MSDEAVLKVSSFVRGYREYMDIWVPNVEEEFQLKREPDNKINPNVVVIVRPGLRGTCLAAFSQRQDKPCHQNELGNDFEVLGHVPK